jgi:putative flippase GtrA
MIKILRKLLRQRIVLYAIIGGACAFIDLGAYNFLLLLSVHYQIANVFSIWLAATIKFFINKKYTFKNKSKNVKKQYASSLIVLIIYVLFTGILLYFFVELLSINESISKVLVLFLGLFVNYILDKLITFGIF